MSVDPCTSFDYIDKKLQAGDERVSALEKAIEENTRLTRENAEITKEVKEILELGKNFFRFLGALGRFMKWVSGIGAGFTVLWALFHNVPPGGK
jgi:hypothetical protein